MKVASLIHHDEILVKEVLFSDTFLARLVGLLGRKSLRSGAALYLLPCRGVHTFFMRFNIDLIFLDADRRVLRLVWNVGPWRCVSGGRTAQSVIEMASGWFPKDGLEVGDRLDF